MARKKKHRPGPPTLPTFERKDMRSFMKSNPGKSPCEKCNGEGCWSCDQFGYHLQCPNCSNEVRETISPVEDDHLCNVCDTYFSDHGEILGIKEEPQQGVA